MSYKARAYARTVIRRPRKVVYNVRKDDRKYRYNKQQYYKRKQFSERISRGMPMQMWQRYKTVSETISFEPAQVYQAYTFFVNSIFDPLDTNGVAQPYLYDQFNAFYSKYRVFSGIIKVTFINRTANPAMMGLCISPDSTAPVTVRDLAQQKGGVKRYVQTGDDQGSTCIIYKAFKVSNYFRNTDIGNKSAAYSANPVELLYCHVRMTSVDSSSPANIQGVIFVELWQNTLSFDYIRQPSSDGAA